MQMCPTAESYPRLRQVGGGDGVRHSHGKVLQHRRRAPRGHRGLGTPS